MKLNKGDENMNRKALTPKELADFLRISRATVYTMVREKELPFYRLRGRIFFDKDVIVDWTKEQQKGFGMENYE